MATNTTKIKVKTRNVKKRDELGDIIHQLKPLTALEYVTGVFRFYARDDQLRPVPLACKAYGLLISTAMIITLAVNLNFQAKVFHFNTFDKISIPAFDLIQILVDLSILLHLLGACRKKNEEIVKKLAEIDKLLQRPLQTQLQRSVSLLTFCLAVFVLALIVFIYFDYYTIQLPLDVKILIYTAIIKINLTQIAFIAYVKLVTKRLSVICDVLIMISDGRTVSNSNARKVFENKEMLDKLYAMSKRRNILQTLAKAFDRADSAVLAINKAFSYDIFFVFAASFLSNITSFLAFVRGEKIYTNLIHFMVAKCIEQLLKNLGTILMCYYSQCLIYYKERNKCLLNHMIMSWNTNQSTRQQAKVFLDVMKNHTLEVNTFQMFTINMRTLTLFMGLSTTYVILVTQTAL